MSQKKQAKLALIGCGRHSTMCLYGNIPYIPEIDLIATCDLKEERAKRNARNFGALRWYTDYEEMISKEELDGVIIVGPPQLHKEAGMKCLQAGLHVLTEKPCAISASEAKEFALEARKQGKYGMVAFMKRFATGYRLAKQIASAPEFGEISYIFAKFTNGPFPAGWGMEEDGLFYLVGQGIHIFDLIRHFGGNVSEVYANFIDRGDHLYGFAVNVTFENGAIGVLNLSSLESWIRLSEFLSVTGVEHYVAVDDMIRLKYYPKDDWIQPKEVPVWNLYQGWEVTGPMPTTPNFSGTLIGFREEIAHFAKCVIEGIEPKPNLEDGYRGLQISEAIWESVKTGKPVKIDLSELQ
jgi:predicted dehydrogenase